MSQIAPVSQAMHICIDMQNIFAQGGVWETPWMSRVLPVINEVAARYIERTVFTRFIPPRVPDERPGRWATYYEKWIDATTDRLPAGQLELVPSLARIAGHAKVVNKQFYSAFMGTGLHEWLQAKSITTLVVTGAETDVCVLSTVLTAVDLGYRIVLVEDALCSSSDDGHDALMTMYRKRLGLQIELTTSDQLPSLWLKPTSG